MTNLKEINEIIEEDNKSVIEKLSNMGDNLIEKSKYQELKKKFKNTEKEFIKNKNSYLLEKNEAEMLKAKLE